MDILAPAAVEAIDNILTRAWAAKRSTLFEHEVYQILSLLGLETPPMKFLRDAAEITPQVLSRFSSDILVMKIVSSAVAHKMAVNGVRHV